MRRETNLRNRFDKLMLNQALSSREPVERLVGLCSIVQPKQQIERAGGACTRNAFNTSLLTFGVEWSALSDTLLQWDFGCHGS
jgi:hypothetical protein